MPTHEKGLESNLQECLSLRDFLLCFRTMTSERRVDAELVYVGMVNGRVMGSGFRSPAHLLSLRQMHLLFGGDLSQEDRCIGCLDGSERARCQA